MSDTARNVRMILQETHEDGTSRTIEYADVPASGPPDPFVISRIAGPHEGSEIITEFAPAPARPLTYPEGLPFIADRAAFTTESPANTTPQGARWLCRDAAHLLEMVVSVSVDDGWLVVPTPHAAQLLSDPEVVLRRNGVLRELQIVPLGEQHMLQLWDVPESLFYSPNS